MRMITKRASNKSRPRQPMQMPIHPYLPFRFHRRPLLSLMPYVPSPPLYPYSYPSTRDKSTPCPSLPTLRRIGCRCDNLRGRCGLLRLHGRYASISHRMVGLLHHKDMPVYITSGFDLAVDNCIQKDDANFQDYGQCDRFDETIGSGWWMRHRQSLASRKLYTYSKGLGFRI